MPRGAVIGLCVVGTALLATRLGKNVFDIVIKTAGAFGGHHPINPSEATR